MPLAPLAALAVCVATGEHDRPEPGRWLFASDRMPPYTAFEELSYDNSSRTDVRTQGGSPGPDASGLARRPTPSHGLATASSGPPPDSGRLAAPSTSPPSCHGLVL